MWGTGGIKIRYDNLAKELLHVFPWNNRLDRECGRRTVRFGNLSLHRNTDAATLLQEPSMVVSTDGGLPQ
jgi:hypothetical protein